MSDKSAAVQIDDIIRKHEGWKGSILSELRKTIQTANPNLAEEVKWKTASRPEGLPVWSYNGILCFAEIWKDNVKLLFPKGALLNDPSKLFNSRLKSEKTRAIEFREADTINKDALEKLIQQATEINLSK